MPKIIAYLGRHEQPHADGSCACKLIVVGDRVVRQVGSVTHGLLACLRDEPDLEHEARTAEHEALLDWEDGRGVERG